MLLANEEISLNKSRTQWWRSRQLQLGRGHRGVLVIYSHLLPQASLSERKIQHWWSWYLWLLLTTTVYNALLPFQIVIWGLEMDFLTFLLDAWAINLYHSIVYFIWEFQYPVSSSIENCLLPVCVSHCGNSECERRYMKNINSLVTN